jgi:2-haloacid dehalogenase
MPSMTSRTPRFEALVFDAYGTLFDVQALAAQAEAMLPGHGVQLVNLWRSKQLEYTWLASLMERHEDFAAITEKALDYALAALVLPLDADGRRVLAAAWRALPVFDDAAPALARLAPRPRWILSNGSEAMLAPLLAQSTIANAIDGVLSVDRAGIYKPSPRVYALACERLGLPPQAIGFVSANAWDAAGAKACGFVTFWINRHDLPAQRLGAAPDHVVGSLDEVATLAGA